MSTSTYEQVTLRKNLPGNYRLTAEAKLILLSGNARPYFSVTGELRNLRRSGDNAIEAGGQMHEEIAEHFPELAPVISVHLADDRGIPMHAIANGVYWLGYTKWQDEDLDAFAHLWRITSNEAREAARYVRTYVDDPGTGEDNGRSTHALTVLFFAMLDRWQKDADHAIATIRRLGEST